MSLVPLYHLTETAGSTLLFEKGSRWSFEWFKHTDKGDLLNTDLTNGEATDKNNKGTEKEDGFEKLSKTCGGHRSRTCDSRRNWKRGLLGQFDSRQILL